MSLGPLEVVVTPLALGPAVAQTFAPASAISGSAVFGPRIVRYDPDTGLPLESAEIEAMLYRRSDLNTPIASLNGASGRRWLDQLSEAGSGGLQLDRDDDDLASFGDSDAVRFFYMGEAAFIVLANDFQSDTIAEGEEYSEVVNVTGPGHVAAMQDAVVYPTRGVDTLPAQDDRVFNWSAPEFDDSAWDTATEIAEQDAVSTYWTLLPANWPYPFSSWIWASSGSQEWAPTGTCYFRKTFTVPPGVSRAVIYLTCDDSAVLYFDGQQLIDTDNQASDPTQVRVIVIDVSPGDHTIGVQATNAPDPENDEIHNPAGLLVAVYAADTTGAITSATPMTTTDGTWLIVEYPPAPPGMTVGRVLRLVLEEAQDRGAITYVERTWDDEVDSEGNAWPEVLDIATKVGNDYLTFLRELSATYIDFRMLPSSWELWVTVRGELGSLRDVTFHAPTDPDDPLSGNLAGLQHHKVATPVNDLLVRWSGGWRERTDSASEATYGRREARLSLGALQSSAEVDRVADQQLDIFKDPRTEITADVEPIDDTDRPYFSWHVGDTVSVPDMNGDSTAERIIALTVSEDQDGNVTFAPELKDRILSQQEAFADLVKKMSDGTLGGQSIPAQPLNTTSPVNPTCCPPVPPTEGG